MRLSRERGWGDVLVCILAVCMGGWRYYIRVCAGAGCDWLPGDTGMRVLRKINATQCRSLAGRMEGSVIHLAAARRTGL